MKHLLMQQKFNFTSAILLLLSLFCAHSQLFAQEHYVVPSYVPPKITSHPHFRADHKTTFGFRFTEGMASGVFKSRLDKNGTGIGMNFGVQLYNKAQQNSRFRVMGMLDYDFIGFGRERNTPYAGTTYTVASNSHAWIPMIEVSLVSDKWPGTEFFAQAGYGWRIFKNNYKTSYTYNGNTRTSNDYFGKREVSETASISVGVRLGRNHTWEFKGGVQQGTGVNVLDIKSVVFDANGNLIDYNTVQTDIYMVMVGVGLRFF